MAQRKKKYSMEYNYRVASLVLSQVCSGVCREQTICSLMVDMFLQMRDLKGKHTQGMYFLMIDPCL